VYKLIKFINNNPTKTYALAYHSEFGGQMLLALIVVFSLTLGFKLILLRNLLKLRALHPERREYYTQRIMVAKMLMMPTIILLSATLIFKYWKG